MESENAAQLAEPPVHGRDTAALATLQAALEDEAAGEVEAWRLVQAGEPAVTALCAALKHPSRTVRSQVARILGERGSARALMPLCDALRRGQIDAAAALGEIALRDPVPELLAAVPLLQQRLQAQPFFDSAETQRTLRLALERIEATMSSIRHLPIPAAAPLPIDAALPVPAAAPAPAVESLPVPAGCHAHGPGAIPEPGVVPGSAAAQAQEPAACQKARRGGRRNWWQRLRRRLR